MSDLEEGVPQGQVRRYQCRTLADYNHFDQLGCHSHVDCWIIKIYIIFSSSDKPSSKAQALTKLQPFNHKIIIMSIVDPRVIYIYLKPAPDCALRTRMTTRTPESLVWLAIFLCC